jgi:hypothetical protein
MAGIRRGKVADDVVFEGVVIPRGTRSARIAAKGITNEEELGNFLTAIFSDTLNGKITLPRPGSGIGGPSKILQGLDHKLKQGLPVTIRANGSRAKKPRNPKAKQTEKGTRSSLKP